MAWKGGGRNGSGNGSDDVSGDGRNGGKKVRKMSDTRKGWWKMGKRCLEQMADAMHQAGSHNLVVGGIRIVSSNDRGGNPVRRGQETEATQCMNAAGHDDDQGGQQMMGEDEEWDEDDEFERLMEMDMSWEDGYDDDE